MTSQTRAYEIQSLPSIALMENLATAANASVSFGRRLVEAIVEAQMRKADRAIRFSRGYEW
jgi:hypothetical protein